jgi:hypothetical protein
MTVVPAKAGTHFDLRVPGGVASSERKWIPAFAGMTKTVATQRGRNK